MLANADPDLFDTEPENDFDRLAELAAEMVGAPVALLSLVDEDRQFFKAAVGLSEPWQSRRGTPLSHSFCRHVVASGDALVVHDAREHPLVRDNPAIEDLGVVAYLGHPVRMPSGAVAGAFCVIDSVARDWTARERHMVATLAGAVENVIALRAATQAQAGILSDIMALNEALSRQSAELAMARLTAESALSQQTRFLAGLSHELRTPLNGIMGGVALLESAPDEASAARCRRMISSSVTSLSECVDDLITFCRLGAGIEAVDVAPFSPHAVVADAAEAQRAAAEAKGLAVSIDIDPCTPASARGDGGLVRRILVNLLGNAVKYTPAGRVGVSVACDVDGSLLYRVSDSGRGVPEAMREAIFEPFNRGDPAVARTAAGTGLGLAIAREMAVRMGGALTLERSAPGEGSTFLLRVPTPDAEAQAA